MKKTILFFAAFAALASCTKENLPDNSQSAESFAITLEATAPSTSGDDTKTTLIEHSLVHWTKGDAIKVGFFPVSSGGKAIPDKSGIFTSTFEEENSANARFSIQNWDWKINNNDSPSADYYEETGFAMYPSEAYFSSSRSGFQGNTYKTEINYTLPAEQTALLNTFEPGFCFSYAEVVKSDFVNNSAKLTFKNACALIKIVLPANVDDVISIKVTSLSDEPLVGKYYYSSASAPTFPFDDFTITDGVSQIILKAPENESLAAGGTYYLVVCPREHSEGLAFTFANAKGKECVKKVEEKIEFKSSKINEFKFNTINYPADLSYTDAKIGDYFYQDGTFSTEPIPGKEPIGIVFYKEQSGTDSDKPTEIDSKLAEACAELGDGVGTHGLVVACNYKTINPQFNSVRASWSTSGGVTDNSTTGAINGITSAGEIMTGYADTKIIKDYFSIYTIHNETCISYVSGLARVTNASPWYLPSVAECTEISKVIGTINDKRDAAELSSLPTSGNYCGTVSQVSNYTSCYVVYDLNVTDRANYGSYMKEVNKNATYINNLNVYTLPIFAF